MTLEELKALPKIELHCHLDGSLSREFLESRLGRKVEPSEIHVSDDCQSLQECPVRGSAVCPAFIKK